MPRLSLFCFGALQATLDNERLTGFHSVKVQALLAYLALEADRPHPREALATLLWPLDSETSARNSLRQALYELRKMLGDRDDSPAPFLLVNRQTVQFNRASDHNVDVADFLARIKQRQWVEAAACYGGELLSGLSCESEPFEEWLRQTRTHWHNQAVDLFFKLTEQKLSEGELVQARTYAERQLALEPWREEAHRQLMTILALSGERSAALAHFETCRRVLAAELGVEPDEETTALYEQIKAGKLRAQRTDSRLPKVEEELTTRLATPETIRHNLPPQPTPFIGRENDLAQIAVRLSDPTCRLLTIIGPGGMGKTRLAIQAARMMVADVFFVALAGVASPDLLVSTIANTLDFTFYGSGEPKTQLLDYLKTRSLLLVLDNCEHLLDGIDLVSDVLADAPGVKVLATSRESLNLREEWLHPLTGMSFPPSETVPAQLESYTSVQFFVQCARQMKPGFDLVAEAAAVVRICRLVDGMPLGIELATTWLKLFPCAQIVREIQQSFDFLTTSLRNVPARHRNMRAVFEHSWRLLAEPEQQALQRLAIFRGGFDRAAAQQVAGAPFPFLVALAEKSLIQIAGDERYQMHELLRQFAEEKLHNHPTEQERVHNEHCRYYTLFLGQQEVRLKGPEHLAAMLIIEAEIENVRAAWTQAVAQDKLDEMEQALESLAYFHETKCWFDQSIVLFQKAADALSARLPEDRRQLLLARILAKQGLAQALLAADAGRPALPDTTQKLEQSRNILQRFGETNATGDVFWGLSFTEPDPQLAQQLRRTALAIYERHGDRWSMARALEGLGFTANLLGQYEEAKQYYRRGIAFCQEIGDRRVLGDIQAIFAEVERALGEYAEANRLAQASLVARTEVGNKRGIAFSLYVLGAIAWRLGNLSEALRYSQQSRDTFTEIGLLGGIDYALSNLGHIACTLGDYAEARRQFHKILQSNLARDFLAVHQPVPWALAGMAEVLRREGIQVQAVELIELVLRHPNAWQEAKNLATKLLIELSAELSAETIATVRAQTRDLKTVVTDLLMVRAPAP